MFVGKYLNMIHDYKEELSFYLLFYIYIALHPVNIGMGRTMRSDSNEIMIEGNDDSSVEALNRTQIITRKYLTLTRKHLKCVFQAVSCFYNFK